MKGKWIGFVTACAVLAAWGATVQADPPPPTLWTSQFGTSASEHASGIALDGSGNIYIAGHTRGDLGGPNQGWSDAFIVACDSARTVQWATQIGSNEWDFAPEIAVDGSGNSYITGYTQGDLAGPNQGWADAFILKCNSSGTMQWTRQIGTAADDRAFGIGVDASGNSYITGSTLGDLAGPNQGGWDAFIVKYDSAGTEQWRRQIGTSDTDGAHGIAVDGSGNSYITGCTYGDLGGPNHGHGDAFIAKYDSGGTFQWASQMGTGEWDDARGIAVDGSGNSYITGFTQRDLPCPMTVDNDVFIGKCDSDGTVQWARHIGSSDSDVGYSIALDGSGNSYITGSTHGDLAGPNQGEADAFIAKYDSGGTVRWMRQIGSSGGDSGNGIAVDSSGNIYITGTTWGDLGGPNQGNGDAFIVAIGSTAASFGDATLDGCVDGLDYALWSSNYQTGTWWVQGDFNGDGYVDGLDYVVWSNNYLQGCPASPRAVPEPASAVLLALGALAIRRRRHSA